MRFDFIGHVGDRLRLLAQERADDVGGGGACERWRAREHLVEDHAQCEEVGTRVAVLSSRLFGRHVPHGAHDDACRGLEDARGACVAWAGGDATQLGKAEVEHLHVAVVAQHDVLGLQVPVHDAGGMGCTQCLRHLRGDLEGLPDVHAAAAQGASAASCPR